MSLPTRGLHAPLRQPPQRRSLTQAGRKPFPLPTRGLHAPPCQLRHATFANRRKRRSLRRSVNRRKRRSLTQDVLCRPAACTRRFVTCVNPPIRRKRRSLCQGFSSSQTDVIATRFAVQNKPLKTARAAWTLA